MQYKASLDKLAKGISIGATILFAIVGAYQWVLQKEQSVWVTITMSAFLLLTYGFVYALRPLGYSIQSEHLVIHRPFANIFIPRHQIESVYKIDAADLKGVIRTFGSGGFFGYFGKFANGRLGSMTWWATRRNNMVMVKTLNRKLVLTPDDVEGFIESLKKTY